MASTLIGLFASLAAAAAAIFSYLAVRALRRQTEAQIVLGCLQAYSNVRRRRLQGLRAESADECRDYYRELFDLHWSEYHLYVNRHLSAPIMRAWLDARVRNYKDDRVIVGGPGQKEHVITYADEWARLVKENYFSPGDRFVEFMNLVHSGRIDEALAFR